MGARVVIGRALLSLPAMGCLGTPYLSYGPRVSQVLVCHLRTVQVSFSHCSARCACFQALTSLCHRQGVRKASAQWYVARFSWRINVYIMGQENVVE